MSLPPRTFAHMYVHLPHYVPERFLKGSRNGNYGAAVSCIDWVMGVLLHGLRPWGWRTAPWFSSPRTTARAATTDGPTVSSAAARGPRGRAVCTSPDRMVARQGPVRLGLREVSTGWISCPPLRGSPAGIFPPTERSTGPSWSAPSRGPGAGRTRGFLLLYGSDLDAGRAGRWKLFVGRHTWGGGSATGPRELYDLEGPRGNAGRGRSHPGVVRELMASIEACRETLGSPRRRPGSGAAPSAGSRTPGRSRLRLDASYFTAMYDLDEAG